MEKNSLVDYIKKCQIGGISDDVIKNKLTETGWSEDDIRAGFGEFDTDSNAQKANQVVLSKKNRLYSLFTQSNTDTEKGLRYLLYGISVFIILFLILLGAEYFGEMNSILPFYALDNILNSMAAFILLKVLWQLTSCAWQRIWIAVWSLPVIAFAIMSTYIFAGQKFGGDDLLLITFWILLPLQVICFVQYLIMTAILYKKRKKTHVYEIPSKKLLWSFALFSILAVCAVGVMFLVMGAY